MADFLFAERREVGAEVRRRGRRASDVNEFKEEVAVEVENEEEEEEEVDDDAEV